MRKVVREIQGSRTIQNLLFLHHTADPFTFLNYPVQVGGPLGSDLSWPTSTSTPSVVCGLTSRPLCRLQTWLVPSQRDFCSNAHRPPRLCVSKPRPSSLPLNLPPLSDSLPSTELFGARNRRDVANTFLSHPH